MLYPSSGVGQFAANTRKIIRFVQKGCTNRPFYHIVVAEAKLDQQGPVIEQLGIYDPMVNEHNEKLVSFNFERIRHWIGMGADTTKSVEHLLGLSGFYPVHPTIYLKAWRTRRNAEEAATQAATDESTKDDTKKEVV